MGLLLADRGIGKPSLGEADELVVGVASIEQECVVVVGAHGLDEQTSKACGCVAIVGRKLPMTSCAGLAAVSRDSQRACSSANTATDVKPTVPRMLAVAT